MTEETRRKQRNVSDRVICPVCPHHCVLGKGQTGRCRARKRETGEDRERQLREGDSSDAGSPLRKNLCGAFIPEEKSSRWEVLAALFPVLSARIMRFPWQERKNWISG